MTASAAACSTDYAQVIKQNWELTLPQEAGFAQAYSADSGDSFFGDGERYHVFTYENAQPVEDMVAWQANEESTAYYDSYSKAAEAMLDAIDVPEDERPDYARCLYWYCGKDDNDELLLFWDRSQSKLYVVESFV